MRAPIVMRSLHTNGQRKVISVNKSKIDIQEDVYRERAKTSKIIWGLDTERVSTGMARNVRNVCRLCSPLSKGDFTKQTRQWLCHQCFVSL